MKNVVHSQCRTMLHSCVKRKCKSASAVLVLVKNLLLVLVVAGYCLCSWQMLPESVIYYSHVCFSNLKPDLKIKLCLS